MEPRQRFLDAWMMVGATGDGAAAFDDLLGRYAEPHRHYHTLQHVLATLDALRDAGAAPDHPAEADLALWYHDAIHDVGRQDNEEASALLARRALAGAPAERLQRIAALIGDTRHDAPASSRDGALVADADLAILGAEPSVFDTYERNIRLEYADIPEAGYRAGRAAVLERLLARPSLYQTDTFRHRFEAPARAALQRTIAHLRRPAI